MKKLWIENIVNCPAKIFAENAPNEDFADKSNDMLEWDNAKCIMDWSRRRDMINPLFYAEAGNQLQNFASLSTEKKLIGCNYFLVPYSIRETIIGEGQDFLNGEKLLSETKISRVNCIESMRRWVWNNYVRKGVLTLAQSQQFYLDVAPYIIDFNEANIYDLKNWIFGLSPHEGIFASKSYYSVGLQNELIDIYNGNY